MSPASTSGASASLSCPPPPEAHAAAEERLHWYPTVARLAPSKHNSQPWRFVVRGDALELWSDPRRALVETDPLRRELVISCGTALHHVEVAARRAGRLVHVDVLPEGGSMLLARITETGRQPATQHDDDLFAAVTRRRTDRGPLDVTPLAPSLPSALQSAAAAHGAVLRLVSTPGDRESLASLVERADGLLVQERGVEQELRRWLRRPGDDRPDGVPVDRTRGAAASFSAEFVQRDFSGGGGAAAHDREGADHPLLGVLLTTSDGIRDWLDAGRALSAVLLEATAAGAYASYLNQPVEVPSLRHELKDALQLDGEPQLVLRIGAGGRVLPTLRRPIEDIRFEK